MVIVITDVNTAASLGEMTSYANDAMIREDTRPIQRLDGPSHIQIRDDDMEYRKRMQEQNMQRPSYRQDDQVDEKKLMGPPRQTLLNKRFEKTYRNLWLRDRR